MLPNFLIAGVAKGGTTSLYYYLSQHPEVQIPKKETFYFIKDFYEKANNNTQPFYRDRSKIIFTEEDYHRLYEKCNAKAVGEVSTCYYYFYKISIPRIRQKLGDIKIIFILRNPVDRAVSGYKFFKRDHFETLTFEESLKDEDRRKSLLWDFMWYYKDTGFYSQSVKSFLKFFSSVKIVLYEDLEKDPGGMMKELFRFIGIDDSFTPDTSVKYNISDSQDQNFWFKFFINSPIAKKIIRPLMKKFIPDETRRKTIRHRLRKPASKQEITLNPETKKQLQDIYKADIMELQQITGKNLSSWLK